MKLRKGEQLRIHTDDEKYILIGLKNLQFLKQLNLIISYILLN